MVIQVWTDGGSRGNPGPAAWGYVIRWADGTEERQGEQMGIATNNEAEYEGFCRALQRVMRRRNDDQRRGAVPASAVWVVTIHTDSQLVVGQLTRGWKVNAETLRERYEWARRMLDISSVAGLNVTVRHVPREQNREADAEVNKALDGASSTEIARPAYTNASLAPVHSFDPALLEGGRKTSLRHREELLARAEKGEDVPAGIATILLREHEVAIKGLAVLRDIGNELAAKLELMGSIEGGGTFLDDEAQALLAKWREVAERVK